MNVTFELTYQELLERRLGLYEHVIYIDPGQSVADMKVDVYIVESRVITDLSVPPISNDLITDVIIDGVFFATFFCCNRRLFLNSCLSSS